MIKFVFSKEHIEQLIDQLNEVQKQEALTTDREKLYVLRGKAVALFQHLKAIGVNPYSGRK